MGKFGCYYFAQELENGVSYSQAKDYCFLKGGRLAEPNTSLKQAILKNLAEAQPNAPDLWWLGATDTYSEGDWRWDSGVDWEYTAWSKAQPNNLYSESGGQDCLFMWESNFPEDPAEYFKWGDEKCSHLYKPVCQWPKN